MGDEKSDLNDLKELFDLAIKERDIDDMITYGRQYYEKLRGHVMTGAEAEDFQNEINLHYANL